jgi:hypothetical protein
MLAIATGGPVWLDWLEIPGPGPTQIRRDGPHSVRGLPGTAD